MDVDQEELKRSTAVVVERFQKAALYWGTVKQEDVVSMMMASRYWMYRGEYRAVSGAEEGVMLCLFREDDVRPAMIAMLNGMPEPVRSSVTAAIMEWMQLEAIRVLEEMAPEERQSAMEGAESTAGMIVAAIKAKVSTTRQQ